MSAKFYMVSRYAQTLIEPVEVERESDQCIWINGRRTFKAGAFEYYFPTWQEAHAHLLMRAEGRLNAARLDLQAAQGHHGNVVGMKEPV